MKQLPKHERCLNGMCSFHTDGAPHTKATEPCIYLYLDCLWIFAVIRGKETNKFISI